MSVSTIGLLLIAAFVLFLVGAAFWLVQEFEQPLELRLRAIAVRRRRWVWIHAWMLAGTTVGVAGATMLARTLRDAGDAWPATVALVVFASGCVGFIVALLISLIRTPAAANRTARTGIVPETYKSTHRMVGFLHAVYMMSAYATFVMLGVAFLGVDFIPAWVGWVGIAAGTSGLIGYPKFRGGPFAPPIIAHAYGLLVGIVFALG